MVKRANELAVAGLLSIAYIAEVLLPAINSTHLTQYLGLTVCRTKIFYRKLSVCVTKKSQFIQPKNIDYRI